MKGGKTALKNRVHLVPGMYAYVGQLPHGCQLCIKGVKMVIFITGLCSEKCFYCPVSPTRLYRDTMFVDEEPAHSLLDFIEEAYRVGADGASITGGDPLVVLKRTVRTIRLLKETLGDEFHVHLYTSGRYASREALASLEEAGLDEIRFHPVEDWVIDRIALARKVLRRTRVGVEMPVIPGREAHLKALIRRLDEMGVEFINLNELEVSERNIRSIVTRGFRVRSDKPVVEGSEEAALRIVRWAASAGLNITVHYCPATYKDRVQLRARLARKALRLRKPYESVTGDGLLARLEVDMRELAQLQGWRLSLEDVATEEGKALLPLNLARKLHGVVRRRYPSPSMADELPAEIERVTE